MSRPQEAENLAFNLEPERTLHVRRRFQRQAMAETPDRSQTDDNGDNLNDNNGKNQEGQLFQQGFGH